MFSGQGSQYFQMGRGLFESNATFRDWMLRLDEVARPLTGRSITAEIYADERKKGDPFDQIVLTHPAIFMTEYALAQALIEAGVRPDMVLGASMGSFAAAAVAGHLDVEAALAAVIRQAEAVEKSSERGGMTAILGDPALYGEDFLHARSELAAVNFATHFVVSARRMDLDEIEEMLRRRGIGYQRLPVHYAFHSRWIDAARKPFTVFMQSVVGTSGALPLVCSDRGGVVRNVDGTYFWDIVRNPIRFRETAARLEEEGARRFIDVGPAGTLATFLRYGLPDTRASVHAILTPFGADRKNFDAVVSATTGQ
jgi:bacillaene synthase trans-acting acyltransferase